MSEKLGRNPFSKGSQGRRPPKTDRQRDVETGPVTGRESPASSEPFLKTTVLRALSWRVESFSFWHYAHQDGIGSFAFFQASVKNHRREHRSPREIRLTLTRRRPLELSLLSLRILSA